jgi:hypothetical protein
MISYLLIAALAAAPSNDLGYKKPKHCACKAMWQVLEKPKTDRMHAKRPEGQAGPAVVCDRVATEADRQRLDPAQAVAVAYAESGFRWQPGQYKDASGKWAFKTSYRGPMQVHHKYCTSGKSGCVSDGVRILKDWRSKTLSWRSAYGGYVGLYIPGLKKNNPRSYARKKAYVGKVQSYVIKLHDNMSRRCMRHR